MLTDIVKKDMIAAMKAGDTKKLGVLRMLGSALKNKEIEKMSPLTDEEMAKVLAKEVKNRTKAIDLYREGGREDLVTKEEEEKKILETYVTS